MKKILKEAGVITDLVQKALPQQQYKTVGAVGKGTSVMAPGSPVHEDGSVDIIIQIRGISGGDAKTAATIGKGAVVIVCESGGLGSKENLAAYGNSGFINTAVNNVLAQLKQQHPNKNIHLGKLTISSFSGGGSAVASLVGERDKLPQGTSAPKFVFIDGLHSEIEGPVMQKLVDYAKQIKEDPTKGQLTIVHTAIVPGGNHASTTQTADHILQQTGLARTPTGQTQSESGDAVPVSKAEQGGLSVVQLHDKQSPYMSGQKVNVPGTSGYQHLQALQYGLKNAI